MLYIDNDNNIYLLGLKEERSGNYQSGATVTVTLYDKETDSEIPGETWPLTLNYISGSVTVEGVTYPGGNYYATLSDSLTLSENQDIRATVKAVVGVNTFHLEHPDVARIRRN